MSELTDLYRKIDDKTARICVVGLGYVGLPTAVAFAEHGYAVTGADLKQSVVDLINAGGCHLHDLGLGGRVADVVAAGRLSATTDTAAAVRASDVVLIIVPTPVTHDKRPDLLPVVASGREIARGLGPGKLVVLESTVYPGVTEDVLKPVLEESGLTAGQDFGLAHCPERYNPGDAQHTIADVVRVIGGITPDWGRAAAALYRNIAKDVCFVENIKTAEAAKIIENVQRDLNIALMNELALIFERMDIDVMAVIRAASTKWNFNVYHPGAGVGGHCLPVDPYYLVHKAEELGYYPRVITAGRSVNDGMPLHVFDLLVEGLNTREKPLKNSKIVVLGFSYKENVGDPRETPVETLLEELSKREARIHVVDPYVDGSSLERFGIREGDAYEALEGADALVLMTAHQEFKNLDLRRVRAMMRTPLIVDGRRIYDREEAVTLGFTYLGIGAPNGRAQSHEPRADATGAQREVQV
jgi:nucleotide sugar dehydrogenase